MASGLSALGLYADALHFHVETPRRRHSVPRVATTTRAMAGVLQGRGVSHSTSVSQAPIFSIVGEYYGYYFFTLRY